MKTFLPLLSRAPWALWLGRLRHPTLFKVALGLVAVSWLVPDPIPLLDEVMFTALALGLANWKRSRPNALSEATSQVTVHNVTNASAGS